MKLKNMDYLSSVPSILKLISIILNIFKIELHKKGIIMRLTKIAVVGGWMAFLLSLFLYVVEAIVFISF